MPATRQGSIPAGSLDRCEPARLAGWARIEGAPPLPLTLHFADRPLATSIANLDRADLREQGVEDGRFGFRFAQSGLTEHDLAQITISIADTGFLLAPDARRPVRRARYRPSRYHRAHAPAGPRQFRTGILHIGTEKTGTSSLQRALFANRAALARHGLFLPLAPPPHAEAHRLTHEFLPLFGIEAHADLDLQARCGITDPHHLWAWRAAAFARLDRQAAAAPPHCTRMLLSSEHCHSRLVTPHAVARLKAMLDPFCDAYEIHVYLRPQHELAISRAGMALMLGMIDHATLPTITPGPPTGEALYFDYDALLDRWATIFGEAAIHPHIFDRTALAGGSVNDDFLIRLGLEPRAFTPTEPIGGNVSPAAHAFLRQLYATREGQALPLATRLWISERLRAIAPGAGAPPPRAAAQEFQAQFAATNEAVRRRWFPHRRRLFPALTHPPNEAPPAPPAAEDFTALLAAAIAAGA